MDSQRDKAPSFLGIGVQKGGTTTLHTWLSDHPEVFLPQQKELHYYTLHYGNGIDWYRSHFEEAPAGALVGEITPYYVFHPRAITRSEADNPHRKLILLLRDPVQRCISHYFHARRLGLEELSLAHALSAETERLKDAEKQLAQDNGVHKSHQEHSYLSRSRYEQQLVRLEQQRSEGRLLVLRSEDLFQQPKESWQTVLEFLELPWIPLLQPALAANAGMGESADVEPDVVEALRRELRTTYQAMSEDYGLEW